MPEICRIARARPIKRHLSDATVWTFEIQTIWYGFGDVIILEGAANRIFGDLDAHLLIEAEMIVVHQHRRPSLDAKPKALRQAYIITLN